jgi:hypothetical protein
MSAKYIIRLDDACPTMQRDKWDKFEALFRRYNVQPIVAVIPDNKDVTIMEDTNDSSFWKKVKQWQDKSWDIALHGYEHLYVTKHSGLVPINDRSEFSGLPYEVQREKIKKGIHVFEKHNINCSLWVAPSHSFDLNTIKALKDETNIDTISDGIAFSPFKKYGMKWVPQQLWRPRNMPFGLWTICYHPETTTEAEFNDLSKFIEENKNNIVSLGSLKEISRRKNILEFIFERLYWNLLKRKQTD